MLVLLTCNDFLIQESQVARQPRIVERCSYLRQHCLTIPARSPVQSVKVGLIPPQPDRTAVGLVFGQQNQHGSGPGGHIYSLHPGQQCAQGALIAGWAKVRCSVAKLPGGCRADNLPGVSRAPATRLRLLLHMFPEDVGGRAEGPMISELEAASQRPGPSATPGRHRTACELPFPRR